MGCAAAARALVRRGWRREGCGFLDCIMHSHVTRHHWPRLDTFFQVVCKGDWGVDGPASSLLVVLRACCVASLPATSGKVSFLLETQKKEDKTVLQYLLTTKGMLMQHTGRDPSCVRCSSKQATSCRHLMQAARHLSKFCSEHRNHPTTTHSKHGQRRWRTRAGPRPKPIERLRDDVRLLR